LHSKEAGIKLISSECYQCQRVDCQFIEKEVKGSKQKKEEKNVPLRLIFLIETTKQDENGNTGKTEPLFLDM